MAFKPTRRGVIVLLGGGLASAALAWTCGSSWRGEPAIVLGGFDVPGGYVEYDGWMLTAADKERVATGEFKAPGASGP